MLELLGSFVIGIFCGVFISTYLLHYFLSKKVDAKQAKIDAAKAIRKEESKILAQSNDNMIIIDALENGPANLIPFHGHKAKILHTNIMLHCLIKNTGQLVIVPHQCVVQDKTKITPSNH